MVFPIEDKLVIAVASSALFRLDEADEIFRSKGLAAYRRYQRDHENTVLAPAKIRDPRSPCTPPATTERQCSAETTANLRRRRRR